MICLRALAQTVIGDVMPLDERGPAESTARSLRAARWPSVGAMQISHEAGAAEYGNQRAYRPT